MANEFQFIDFGAGKGGSFDFATSCVSGTGLAIDKSEDAVNECRKLGIAAEQHDVLEFTSRNLVQATFAISLMQELSGPQAFRQALVNIIRAATHFTVIQHPYYDRDAELAARGLLINEHFDKRTLFRPTLADYLSFVSQYGEGLAIAGIAAYTSGKITAEPANFASAPDEIENELVPKTLRIVIGRKSVARFRRAQFRAEVGKPIFVLENEAVDA